MSANANFHIVGDSYVDLFCFLSGSLPEQGGDSELLRPVTLFAGGSTINTATHLKPLISGNGNIIVQTVLNKTDGHGRLLLRHCSNHDFEILNCSKPSALGATPHCVVVVSESDRAFMTHRGCAETFNAMDLDVNCMIESTGHLYLHIAGFYCTPGFQNGSLRDQLSRIRKERNSATCISLVTQYDATEKWDGGFRSVIPFVDFVIMNELEANKLLASMSSNEITVEPPYPEEEWISEFSLLNPNAWFVITKGENGAIVFQNHAVVARIDHAVEVEAVDPTGAGDAFVGGFLYGLWKKQEGSDNQWSNDAIRDALSWGCAAGTSAVTVRGASIPSSLENIASLVKKRHSAS